MIWNLKSDYFKYSFDSKYKSTLIRFALINWPFIKYRNMLLLRTWSICVESLTMRHIFVVT
jgi:hypothetical protein